MRRSASGSSAHSDVCDSRGGRSMRRNELLQRARRAYERGRILKALRSAGLVLPMTLVSFGSCADRTASLAIAALLGPLAMVLVWRGGATGRGVVPGFVAGAAS